MEFAAVRFPHINGTSLSPVSNLFSLAFVIFRFFSSLIVSLRNSGRGWGHGVGSKQLKYRNLTQKPKHARDTVRVGEKQQDFLPNQSVPKQVENVITSLNS